MNDLLQDHGCSNVFTLPEGLRELMADIAREVLREQPPKIFDFIANYLSALLITREHGLLAVKILDDLCDCRPTVSEHLIHMGVTREEATSLSQIIKEQIERCQPMDGTEKLKETELVKRVLKMMPALDEETTAKVCQIARNAYRDYWYRKNLLEKRLKTEPEEAWEIAAHHTLEIYKRTKPSFSELTRATQKIQAAYRGYHVRRHVLRHLKSKSNTQKPKVDLPGPPIDAAASREIELGPVLDLKPKEDKVEAMFQQHAGKKLGLKYDPTKTLTHVEDFQVLMDVNPFPNTSKTRTPSRKSSIKSQSQFPRNFRESFTSSVNMRSRLSSPTALGDSRNRPPTNMPSLTEDEVFLVPEGPKISFAQREEIYIDDSIDVIQELLTSEAEDEDAVSEVFEDIPDHLSDRDTDTASIAEDITQSTEGEE